MIMGMYAVKELRHNDMDMYDFVEHNEFKGQISAVLEERPLKILDHFLHQFCATLLRSSSAASSIP